MITSLRSLAQRQTAVTAGCAAALLLVFGAMFVQHDLAADVPLLVTLALGGGVVYFVALYALANSEERRGAFWLILAAGIVFRILLLPAPAELSEDLHRYRWDGRVQINGWNPYAVKPEDERLRYLRPSDWNRTPAQENPTIYPPLVQLTFREWARTLHWFSPDPPLVWYKGPFVAADLLVLAMLAGRVRRGGGRNYQLAVYAWNPLVIVEIAGSGHMDSLAMAALLAAVLLLEKQRAALSTVLLSAAALLKVFPLTLVPLWLRRTGWPRARQASAGAAGALALAVVAWWPFRGAEPTLLQSLDFLERHWRHNNAGLYMLLRNLSDSHDFAAGIAAGVVVGVALWCAARNVEPVRAIPLVIAAILLFSQNSFSWYFTWAIPLLCLAPLSRFGLAWLLLSITQFISYHVLINYYANRVWRFENFYLLLTYAPFFVMLFWPRTGKVADQ